MKVLEFLSLKKKWIGKYSHHDIDDMIMKKFKDLILTPKLLN